MTDTEWDKSKSDGHLESIFFPVHPKREWSSAAPFILAVADRRVAILEKCSSEATETEQN